MAKYDIFISYKRTGTRSSEAYGYTLQQLLLQAGYSVFFDQSEMHLGNWEEQLRDNIAGATDVLVLLEQNSLASCYADELGDLNSDEPEALVVSESVHNADSEDAEQSDGGAPMAAEPRYRADWFCREIIAAIEQKKNIVPILIDGYMMPSETELPAELRYITKCQALQPHGIPSLGDLVETKLINQEDALRSKPSRGTIRRKKSICAAQFLVYGDGCNFDMYEYGDLVASLNSSHTAFHPFAYGVDFGGEHRFRFVNNDTGETQELIMNIDPDRQLYVGLTWREHQCLWTLTEQQIQEELDTDRLCRWGKWLFEGNSLYEPDIERSYQCMARAADLGSVDARTFFAAHGEGLIVNKKASRQMAITWYHRSAEYGNTKSMIMLGNVYLKGDTVEQDYAQALEWYKKSAEKGDVVAMRLVGNRYYKGEGVEKDFVQALEWYKKSAEKGDVVAMRLVGSMYSRGEGVEKDPVQALAWHSKAAANGDAIAMRLVGNRYYYGEGVEKDFTQASNWYRKSAEKGDKQVLNNLAWTYHLMGQYADALPWAEKAIAAQPEDANVIDTLATVYQGLHRYDDALEQFERCLAIYQDMKDDRSIVRTQTKIEALRLLMG